MTTLRSISLGAFVVAAATHQEYVAIVRLTESGLWNPGADTDTVVAALLTAPRLHDVHCRRGIEAVLSGRHSTRARTVLRSKEFASTFGRISADSLIGLDASTRLLRMGAPLKLLAVNVMKNLHQQEGCGIVFLKALSLKRKTTTFPIGKELLEIVLGSEMPGALLRFASDVLETPPELLFACSPDAANDSTLLARLANDGEFMASRGAVTFEFHRRIVFLACRTGSESLLEAVESIDTTAALKRTHRDVAVRLCRDHWPAMVERVGALRCREASAAGLMQLVEYGAQDIHFAGLHQIRNTTNYNVLRIMSGLGGFRDM